MQPAQGGFVGDLPCELAIAAALPIEFVLSFDLVVAKPRNDLAFDCGFVVAVVPSIVVFGLPWCLRRKGIGYFKNAVDKSFHSELSELIKSIFF